MKRLNSTGGYRIYPSSPDRADIVNHIGGSYGIFNDGLDRFRNAREMSPQQQSIINELAENDPIKRDFQNLELQSAWLWSQAENMQRHIYHGDALNLAPFSVEQLGSRLIEYSRQWLSLKSRVDNLH